MPAREPGGLATFFEVVNAHAASAVGFVQDVGFGDDDVGQTCESVHLTSAKIIRR